jgi:putative transposase
VRHTHDVRKTFKYRLYPSRVQVAALEHQLAEACRLYNACLQERRECYRATGKTLTYYDQAAQLKEIRADGACELANFSASQEVLRRVDRAFAAFFRRLRERRGKAGYPRFRSARRYDSLTFPSYGDGVGLLETGKLRVQGVGPIKAKLHRPVDGTIKTVTIKRQADRWFVCFSVECEPEPLPASSRAVGSDVGLEAFATLSDGSTIENPRYRLASERRLRVAQRKVARRTKRSRRRRSAVRELERAHAHIGNQRSDFEHKVARRIVDEYDLIGVEDLNVKGLAGGMLAKSVHDVGWSAFIERLAHKAEGAGRELVRVDPRGTSQRCPCGEPVPKTLSDRWHACGVCGLSVARDHASALEILRLALLERPGRGLQASRAASAAFA